MLPDTFQRGPSTALEQRFPLVPAPSDSSSHDQANLIHVPKRRQGRAIPPHPAIRSILPAAKLFDSAAMPLVRKSGRAAPSGHTKDKLEGAASPSAPRAVTWGASYRNRSYNRAGSRSGSTSPNLPDQTRAVSYGSTRFKAQETQFPDPHPTPKLHRQPSLKYRLFSRFKNSLISKPSSEEMINQRCSSAQTQVGGAELATKTSIASISTNRSLDYSDLGRTLSAFPNPPHSTMTSPTIPMSFESTLDTWPPRRLCVPRDMPTLGLEMKIIPELDTLSSDGKPTMYVAVEIRTSTGISRTIFGDSVFGLDIAVIVDNS